jgi:hypothetical protein
LRRCQNVAILAFTMSDDECEKLVDSALQRLAEHFDAVQILVSWKPDGSGNTKDLFQGSGNWYARQGMAHEFIRLDEAQVKARAIGHALKDEE